MNFNKILKTKQVKVIPYLFYDLGTFFLINHHFKFRLNKSGIRKVTVSRKDLVGATLSISNILVHENFKSPVSKSAPENNDLGE